MWQDNFHISMTSSPEAEESEREHRHCAAALEMRILLFLCQGMSRVTDSFKFIFWVAATVFEMRVLPCLRQGMFRVTELWNLFVELLRDVRITLYGPQEVGQEPFTPGCECSLLCSIRSFKWFLACSFWILVAFQHWHRVSTSSCTDLLGSLCVCVLMHALLPWLLL